MAASPLAFAKASVAELAKEVEVFRRECAEVLKRDVSAASTEARDLCTRCVHYHEASEKLLNQVEALTVDGEPKKMVDFAQRKRQEIQRLQALQARLSNLSSQLEPYDANNTLAGDISMESTDVELSSHLRGSTVDSSPERAFPVASDSEDQSGSEYELPQAVAIAAYEAQQEGDLAVQEGEVFYIVDMTREDGWWQAENENGVYGLVPSNHFELIRSDSATDLIAGSPVPELDDNTLGEETDITRTEDTPEVDLALTAGREPQSPEGGESKRLSGAERWKKLKSVVTKPTAAQVLQALGAIPSGFRCSMLADLQKQSIHSTRHYFSPKVDGTGLVLEDLHWDPGAMGIKPVIGEVLRGVTVISCRKIPLLPDNVSVLKRQVRVAIFDKLNVLSNIIATQASIADKDPRSWKFSKVAGQSATDASFMLRAEKLAPSLCMLFELAMVCQNNKSREVSELSCGWATLDFLSATGVPIANRSYELKLNGGTPFDSGVELDLASASDGRFASLKSSLLQGVNTPMITVKTLFLGQDVIDLVNTLPRRVVARNTHLQLLSLYRQSQAFDFVASRPLHAATPVCSVLHSTFPQAVDDCDLMDMLLAKFADGVRNFKRENRQRQPSYKRLVFCDTVEKDLYILLMSSGLPAVVYASPSRERERQLYIQQFTQQPDTVASLFTSAAQHRPFHASEVAFTVGRAAPSKLL